MSNFNPLDRPSMVNEVDVDVIEYVNPQELLRLRSDKTGEGEESGEQDPKEAGLIPSSNSIPIKRIHTTNDLNQLIHSIGLNRLILILINISNRLSKFGILQFDDQIVHLKASLNQRVQSIIDILDELDSWITDIPLDETPQRFGNKAFKIWGQRLNSESKRLHERVIGHEHKPIEDELLHHFTTAFGSFVRLDYGTGHELSFLAYLSILHLTRILKNEDLLLTGLIIFQRYFDLCRSLQRTFNLEPAGSKGVYGLDDFFHIVYIFGSAQLLYHPTIQPSSILDEKFVFKINQIDQEINGAEKGDEEHQSDPEIRKHKLSSSSKEFIKQHGLVRSIFFESIQNTIDLKSKTPSSLSTGVHTSRSSGPNNRMQGQSDPQAAVHELKNKNVANTTTVINTTTTSTTSLTSKSSSTRFLDHSPILWNLGSNVKTWSKIHNGLIKMFKGEILNKLPVMQHFWMTDSTGVLSWTDLKHHSPSTKSDKLLDDDDPNYKSNYSNVSHKPVQLPSIPTPNIIH